MTITTVIKHILPTAAIALGAIVQARAIAPEYYSTTSPFENGRWVKIEVTETGMQEISAAQLAGMGFDDPDRVAVYGFSAIDIADHALTTAHADELPAVPAIVSNGKLIFYGEAGFRHSYTWKSSRLYTAFEQNPHSTSGYYFLTEEDSPARLTRAGLTGAGSAITTVYASAMHNFLDYNPFTAGTQFFSRDLTKSSEPMTVSLYAPCATGTYNVTNSSAYVVEGTTITFTWPEGSTTTTQTRTLNAYVKDTAGKMLTPSDDGHYEVTVTTDGGDYAACDYLGFTYRRSLRFDKGEEQFTMMLHDALSQGRPFEFHDAPAGLEMWDITNGAAPARLDVVASGTSLRAINVLPHTATSSTPPSRFIAFNPAGELHKVKSAGPVTPSAIRTIATPELLIIAAPTFTAEAERLASLHRSYQQMEVTTVCPTDIYNEFSSGTPSADAIRRYIKMLYDREPGRLRHVLIIGSCHYDPRGILSGHPADPATDVPAYATEVTSEQINATRSYCTDSFYGKLTDGDFDITAPMDINVGRLPALSAEQLSAYIDKVGLYLAEPPATDLRSRIISMADHGNKNGHVNQAEDLCRMIAGLQPSSVILKAYDALYDSPGGNTTALRKAITGALREGTGYMTYSGHGNTLSIGSQRMWNIADVTGTSLRSLPFVTLSTCDTYPFDRQLNSIGEQFLFTPGAGAIALVASCRTVQMNYNQELNLAVAHEYFSPDATTNSLGDIYRSGHNYIMKSSLSGLKANTLCYNFGGDPALPLYTHTHAIALDNDDGIAFEPLKGGNTISGSITGADGLTDGTFEGTLTATLYAPAELRKMLNHDNSDTLKDITCQGAAIAMARGRISGGRFSISMTVPAVSYPGGSYRLQLAAVASASHDCAGAALSDVTVSETDPELDTAGPGPEIAEFYADDNTFTNGDLFAGSVTLRATILPSAYGISTGSSLARTSYIDIDGSRTPLSSHFVFETDGHATVTLPTGHLNDGHHTATISVADYAGNRSSQTIAFSVINRPHSAALSADRATASDEVTVSLSHTFPGDPDGRLSFIDKDGETVYTVVNPSYPYTWDLRDTEGHRVPDGHYTIRAWLNLDRRYTAASPAEIVIIQD